METESLDQGRLTVARRFAPLLQANHFDCFARVMAAPGGELKRNFPGRRTSRIELRRPDGTPQAVYLKRYDPSYLRPLDRFLRALGWPGAGDEARTEWDAAAQVRALGIPTLEAIARGQDHPSPRSIRSSFVMTLELANADEGDRVVAGLSAFERRQILRRVAECTRRLHRAGYVHKDLYLCHYMVSTIPPAPRPAGPGQASERPIYLIDLQRLARPRWFQTRWIVKDLAALCYSSLKAGARRADLAAAFRSYRANQRLDDVSRRLARRVLRRVDWSKTRTPKHDTNFRQLP